MIFRSITNAYNDLKLQSKFMLALILIVFIPAIFVGTLFYNRLYGMVISDTIRSEQDAASRTVPAIDGLISDITEQSSELTQNDFYQTLFFQPINTNLGSLLASSDGQAFRDYIDQLVADSPLTAIHFYVDLPSEELAVSQDMDSDSLFSPLRDARTYWRGIFRSNSGLKELYCPAFYLGTREKEFYGDNAYIRRTTIYYFGEAAEIYVVCYYSSDSLVQILSENTTLDHSVSYLVNDRDYIVASSNITLTGTYLLDYASVEESFMSSTGFVHRTILDQEVYAGYYSISAPRWFMVTVLPSKPMIAQGNRIILQLVMIYVAFLILAIILSVLLSGSITKRISSVIRQMRRVREGPPVPMQSSKVHDEVGDLIDTYNYMTAKMNRLMEEQAQAAEDLRIAEFKSLQAQINPHFLYNTMDMINWLAQQGRTDEISDAVQNLSRFYKLTLSKKNGISTIANEVEHVSIYVRLQNMRFHDNISFISDLPDELLDYQIPKLTLQPVIENAILHGILEKETKSGTIVLTGWIEEEDIVLLISDDGIGIPKETLDIILTGNGSSSSGGTNIAVYNTHRRLEILYGEGYGLHYTSQLGSGTEVEIRLPAKRTE